MEELSNGAFRRCIELINAGEVFKARAILARDVVWKDADNAAAWALMAHLVDDRAEEIHCLEQVVRLQPDNHYARYRLLRLRNNGTMSEEPLAATSRPFRFTEPNSLEGGVDLSNSWIMPQGRKSKASRGLLGWGVIPEMQGTWPTGLKYRTIMIPFSEEAIQPMEKPLPLSIIVRGMVDKLLILAILSALTLLL
ncbi:MAG: hypothetical protein JSV37_02000 [Anaerolineaceae bacterium]|nr:MAG: hypothetical protein JSV37_02000 [Anaerolineaceae bacterium]